jgi:hypothetical protein
MIVHPLRTIQLTILALLLNVGWMSERVSGQGSSDNPTTSKASPKEIAIKEQIRQVKRSLDTLGPKHPAWEATAKKLEDLEKKLAALAGRTSPVPMPMPKGTDEVPKPGIEAMPKEDTVLKEPPMKLSPKPRIDTPSPLRESIKTGNELEVSDPLNAWVKATLSRHQGAPYKGYSRAPAIVTCTAGVLDTMVPLFDPSLTRGITKMGRIDETGAYWGLEIDPELGLSRVWEIRVDETHQGRRLLWQTSGVLLAIHIGGNSSRKGTWYAIRRQSLPPFDVQLLEIKEFRESSLDHETYHETLLAILSPERRELNDSSIEYLFGEGPLGCGLVFGRQSFQLQAKTDPERCIVLDPTASIFWSNSNPPSMKEVRKYWLELSRWIGSESQLVSLSKDFVAWTDLDRSGLQRLFIKETADRVARQVSTIPESIHSPIELIESLRLDQDIRKVSRLTFRSKSSSAIWSSPLDRTRSDSLPERIYDTSKKVESLFKDHSGRILVLIDQNVYSLESLISTKKNTNLQGFKLQDRSIGKSVVGKLSDTQLFVDLESRRLREYFFEYELSDSNMVHGASSRYYIAIPEGKRIERKVHSDWGFPEGSIFVQACLPKHDENLRVLVKSKGQWLGFEYRWIPGTQDAVLVSQSGVGGLTMAEIASTPSTKAQADCWSCHLSDQNDGILGFGAERLARVSEKGLLQTEFLKLAGVFEKQGGQATRMDRRSRDELVVALERLQVLTPRFAQRVLANQEGFKELVDGFLLTGDTRFVKRLRDLYPLDSVDENLLIANSSGYESRISSIQQVQSLCLLDGNEVLRRRVGQAAMNLIDDLREMSKAKGQPLPLDENFDCANILFDAYEAFGSNWARDDALEFVKVLNRHLEDSNSLASLSPLLIAQVCFVNIRAMDATKDERYLERVKGLWGKLRSIEFEAVDEHVLEIAMINRCILRSLACELELDDPQNLYFWLEQLSEVLDRHSSRSDRVEAGKSIGLEDHEIPRVLETLLEGAGIVPRLILLEQAHY